MFKERTKLEELSDRLAEMEYFGAIYTSVDVKIVTIDELRDMVSNIEKEVK